MAGHSVAVDFWIESSKIISKSDRENVLRNILPIIEPFSGSLKKVSEASLPGGHYAFIFASEIMSLSVKMYKQGLISSTLEYFVDEDSVNVHKILNDDGRHIERELLSKFVSKRAKVLPALKRAPPKNPYFTSSDDRILEYDVDCLLFDETSEFQKVQIFHTTSFGNMLVLDDLQNLGESDLVYTQSLMNKGKEDFMGKEILILGGGDGALLWELLKEEPAFVTMIDIDEVVMKACRKYMKSVCGDIMDNYDGKNYKIIVGDAIAYMKDYLKEGRKFDYVYGDLTDVPISTNPRGQLWDFMREIWNLGIQIVKPSGKYMTHATGIQCDSALKMFEEQITKLVVPVSFTRTNAYIPSFMENWCFYQLSPKDR